MLFSHPQIQEFVNQNMVAAWQSMRAVPRATIDFGDGRVVERTMNGNIATYICTPDGQVIDVIAGLVSPEHYLSKLKADIDAWRSFRDPRVDVPVWNATGLEHLKEWGPRHQEAVAQEAANAAHLAAISKSVVELPMRDAFGLEPFLGRMSELRDPFDVRTEGWPSEFPSGEDARLEARSLQLEDEDETWRRAQYVRNLLSREPVVPGQIEKAIYLNVLHVDLDDPWLGLAIKAFEGGAYGPRR